MRSRQPDLERNAASRLSSRQRVIYLGAVERYLIDALLPLYFWMIMHIPLVFTAYIAMWERYISPPVFWAIALGFPLYLLIYNSISFRHNHGHSVVRLWWNLRFRNRVQHIYLTAAAFYHPMKQPGPSLAIRLFERIQEHPTGVLQKPMFLHAEFFMAYTDDGWLVLKQAHLSSLQQNAIYRFHYIHATGDLFVVVSIIYIGALDPDQQES